MVDKPRYPRQQCVSCVYLGTVKFNHQSYDVYRCGESGIVLRWGIEPYSYYAAQVSEFQMGIRTFRDHDRNRTEPSARELNAAWDMAAQRWAIR